MENKDINKIGTNALPIIRALMSDKVYKKPEKVGSCSLAPKATNSFIALDTPENRPLINQCLMNYYGEQLNGEI